MALVCLCVFQLTSQDKTPQVIQRALEKHHLEHMSSRDFSLTQIISGERGEAGLEHLTGPAGSLTHTRVSDSKGLSFKTFLDDGHKLRHILKTDV